MDKFKDRASSDPFEGTNDEVWDEAAVSSADEMLLAALGFEEPEPETEEKQKEKNRVGDTTLTRRESFRVNRILYLSKLREKAQEIEGRKAEAQDETIEEQEVTETEWLEDAFSDSEIQGSAEVKKRDPAEAKARRASEAKAQRASKAKARRASEAKVRRPSDVKARNPVSKKKTESIKRSPAEERQPKKSRKILCGILYGVVGLLVFLISLIGFSANWAFSNWGEIDINEIIFQLQAPLGGTGNGMVGDFLLKALLPSVLILAVFIVLLILMKKGKRRIIVSCGFLLCAIAAAIVIKNGVWKRLDIDSWLAGQKEESVFIQQQYVDPGAVALQFPDQKRNLISIYLESMETTYADEASGGAFKENVIPELTKLAQENEDFSGNEKEINGGIVLPGTNYTSGAIFGLTTGLPLKVEIGADAMVYQESFLPGIVGLGDILEEQGYNQVFLLGSDATFGGRRLYFETHGNFEIMDHIYAQKNKWIAPDYSVFWGFEDEILFKNAKKTLQKLAQEDKPFHLTILTVDTHFEDGYVCDLCRKEFGEDQYSNVMACSSRQVDQFIRWLQTQDFYENTTVVLTGDHTTMDTDYCQNVPDTYSRKTYTAYVNAAQEPHTDNWRRDYSTLDNFPTTLAALGVNIPGNRLGLGTDLFSGKKTLIEEYGYERLRREFNKKSDFLERLEGVSLESSDAILNHYRYNMKDSISIDNYDKDKGQIQLSVTVNEALHINPVKIELEYQEAGTQKTKKMNLTRADGKDDVFYGTVDISGWSKPDGEIRVNMFIDEETGFNNVASLQLNAFCMQDLDFIDYFTELSNHPEYTVFLAVKDDASTGMTEEMQIALEKIGVQTVLSTAPQVSYYAIVGNGFAVENNGYEVLHYDGIIESTGVPYSVESSGYYTGSKASIMIDGVEYAPNTRGLNIVVYDSARRQVIDARCFDTSANPEEPEIEMEMILE